MSSDDTLAEERPIVAESTVAPPVRRRGLLVPRWFAIVVVLLLVGGLGFAIGWFATPDDSGSSRSAASQGTEPSRGTTPAPSTTAPPVTGDPSAEALRNLGLRQSDLTPSVSLVLIPGGNRVSGAPTLDLCNATYPSESERKARLQVAGLDGQGNVDLSTEAVLYSNAAATEQAFTELKAAAANCPNSPVQSPVGEPTTTTKFNSAPDGSWAQVAGVDRLAFDFVTTDDQGGEPAHSVAVYLRRGRALMGIYFPQPDSAQAAVAGQTTIAGIVNVFAERMAHLPDSVVN